MHEIRTHKPIFPVPGEIWRHYKGNEYAVIDYAHDKDGILNVIYQRFYRDRDGISTEAHLPVTFLRPIHEWLQTVEYHGGKPQRFVRTQEA